eukprot:7179218-Heterocapsa_arctica.AAC.1
MPEEIQYKCEQSAIYTGIPGGPINYFRRVMKDIGWVDNTPTNITDHERVNRELKDWPSFVKDGIDRSRQLAWEKAAKSITNYKGVEGGVD